jgi:hypothetical protein
LLQCPYCDRRTPQSAAYARHIRDQHPEGVLPSEVKLEAIPAEQEAAVASAAGFSLRSGSQLPWTLQIVKYILILQDP